LHQSEKHSTFFQFCANLLILNMPQIKCPTCGKQTEYSGNEFRPFCSERCKLLDFGAWANEEFALPAENTPLTEEDLQQLEQAATEKEKNR
jgi:endogenous inhibitor of DNA gyrase (YacG/DUF329 family)